MRKSISMCIILLWMGGAFAGDPGLKLTVSLDDSAYMVDEPVFVEVLLQNISNRAVKALPMFLGSSWHNFDIELTDTNGEKIPRFEVSLHMLKPARDSKREFAPNERFILVQDLLTIFGQRDRDAHTLRAVLTPGEYIIRAFYRLDEIVMTDSARFKVVKPSTEEQAAHDLLLDIFRLISKSKEPIEKAKIVEKFEKAYPNSSYKAVAHALLLIYYTRTAQNDKKAALINSILRDTPESGLAYEILDYHKPSNVNLIKGSRAEFYYNCIMEKNQIMKRKTVR